MIERHLLSELRRNGFNGWCITIQLPGGDIARGTIKSAEAKNSEQELKFFLDSFEVREYDGSWKPIYGKLIVLHREVIKSVTSDKGIVSIAYPTMNLALSPEKTD